MSKPPAEWPEAGHAVPPIANKLPLPPEPPPSRVIREGHEPPPPPTRPTTAHQQPIDHGPGILNIVVNFLKGTTSHLGTTKNLLREVSVGTMTAVGTLVVINLASLQQPSDVEALRDVVNLAVEKSHEADSLSFELRTIRLHRENDSLRRVNYWLNPRTIDSLEAAF
ncbi:hypothetical protein [Spirosoma oryzicola]|uniref:hypothetical protein n=1 Tax=Spirosoma oryzicola TaxID=2898794 RepID=UPI001E3F770B|nr:hypothetical protein [Spirosoma oryzicola]UHG93342.1 hypothetical protein LQ777_10660 [Spirosoma oryzicola]